MYGFLPASPTKREVKRILDLAMQLSNTYTNVQLFVYWDRRDVVLHGDYYDPSMGAVLKAQVSDSIGTSRMHDASLQTESTPQHRSRCEFDFDTLDNSLARCPLVPAVRWYRYRPYDSDIVPELLSCSALDHDAELGHLTQRFAFIKGVTRPQGVLGLILRIF